MAGSFLPAPPAHEPPVPARMSVAARISTAANGRLVATALSWCVALFLIAPIVVAAAGAFSSSEFYGHRSEGSAPPGSLGLFWYVFSVWGRSLGTSAALVAVVVPFALLIGAPAAYAFRRRPFSGSKLLEAASMTPLSMPGIALAVSLLATLGGAPRFTLLAGGHLAYTIPLVIRAVGNALESFEPDIEPAARSLGAGPWQVARWITIPVLLPSLVVSALLVFTVSWGEFNASFLLASPLAQSFPAALYVTYTANSFPVAAAATILFLLPVVPALVLIQAIGGEPFRRGLQA